MRHLHTIARSGLRWWLLARKLCRDGGANQRVGELAPFLAAVADFRPRTLLEIGVADGGNLASLARAAAPEATLIGVDPHPGPGAELLIRRHMAAGQHLELLPTTAEQALATTDLRFDLVFIDGDHERVCDDFRAVWPRVRQGGWIALHDIVPDGGMPNLDSGRVPEFWKEINGTRSWIEDPEQQGYGIGLIEKDEAQNRPGG